jgi:hypothetical protein
MKSSEMQISVYRNENDEPCFRYPKDWDVDKVFEQMAELCCVLQAELRAEQTINRLLRYRLDNIKEEIEKND